MGVSLGGGDNWFCLLSYLWPNVYQNSFCLIAELNKFA